MVTNVYSSLTRRPIGTVILQQRADMDKMNHVRCAELREEHVTSWPRRLQTTQTRLVSLHLHDTHSYKDRQHGAQWKSATLRSFIIDYRNEGSQMPTHLHNIMEKYYLRCSGWHLITK